jgi:hypothetical protein
LQTPIPASRSVVFFAEKQKSFELLAGIADLWCLDQKAAYAHDLPVS